MEAVLFNFRCWVDESDSTKLKNIFDLILEQVDFEILGFIDHHFKPQGYTSVWLLGESHLAIHTYPEHNKSYVEITSCAKEKNFLFEKLVDEHFKQVEKV